MRTLRQQQSLFAAFIGHLIRYAYAIDGVELTLADGSIDPWRKVKLPDGRIVTARDAVHKIDGLHYVRLAQDLNLFVHGTFIEDGAHPVWKRLGLFWEALHPDCRWGGRFRDSNHFSMAWLGRAVRRGRRIVRQEDRCMPVTTRKVGGGKVRVSTPSGVKAKATTPKKAAAQKRLLNAVDHGFKPTKGGKR